MEISFTSRKLELTIDCLTVCCHRDRFNPNAPGAKVAMGWLLIEPSRVIIGNARILVCRVLYTKQLRKKRLLIQDAALDGRGCPACHESHHRSKPTAIPERALRVHDAALSVAGTKPWDTVGPVCKSRLPTGNNRPQKALN
jgi:diaminopimelate decarboxylase